MQNVLNHILTPGILGILFHVFVIKVISLKRKAKAANMPFSFSQFLQDEWPVILGNFICVCMLIVGLDELIGLKPSVAKLVKWLFFFVGISGSSIFMLAFSVADKRLRNIIDAKTNVADDLPLTKKNKQVLDEIKEDANK